MGLPGIHYLSHTPYAGYSVAARRMIMALADRGVPIRWSPIRWDSSDPLLGPDDRGDPGDPDLDRYRFADVDADVVVVHSVPEMLPALAPLATRAGRRAALVCHTVWEHEPLQDHWPALLNRCDGVIVPTRWNAESFRSAGVTVPVAVVPHVIDSGPVDDRWLGAGGLDLGTSFVVHCIATWSWRKEPWMVVTSFARAFGPEDDATLVLRTDLHMEPGLHRLPGPDDRRDLSSWTVAHILHRHAPTARVHLVHDELSFPQVTALHRRSDCWLSLPHAEGWDLGAFDAATAGTPVITTAHPGPLSYLDPAASTVIPGAEVPMAWLPGATWIEPDVDLAVESLRAVWADPTGARERAAVQAERLRRDYAPDVVSRRFLDALVEIGVT